MPANTPLGLPYPLPTEPVAEGAQAIRNLAEAVDVRLATLLRFTNSAQQGPTSISGAGDGNGLFDLGARTFRAVPYWIELGVQAGVTGAPATLELRLHEGTVGAPVALIQGYQVPLQAPSGGIAQNHFIRSLWTPAARAYTLSLRWKDLTAGGGKVYTLFNSTNMFTLVIREAN